MLVPSECNDSSCVFQRRFVSSQGSYLNIQETQTSCTIVRKSLLNILDRLAEGEKLSKGASEFGIGNSTVNKN